MKKIFAIFAVAAMLFACEEPVPETTLSLDNAADATLNLSTEAVEKVVAFSTNAAWTAAADAEWITVTPAAGEAGNAIQLTIAVAANETFDNRAGKVTITAGDKNAEVAINQMQTDAVNVGEEILYIGYEGGEVELPVNHNIEYTVTSDADWAVVGGTRALTTSKTVINVEKNGTAAERTATLLVEAAGFEYEVYLVQKGNVFSTTVVEVLGDRVSSFVSGPMTGSAVTSLAILGDQLVVCPGDGQASKLINKATGAVEGTLNTGDFVAHFVANDDAGNLILCNRNLYDTATYWWTADFQLYYMTSATATPVQLINGAKYGPIGAGLEVRGDVTNNAIIIAPYEGIPGVTMAVQMEVWQIVAGAVAEPIQIQPSGYVGTWSAGAWNCAPGNFPAFALISENIADGALFAVYEENAIYHIDGTTFAATKVVDDPVGGNFALNSMMIRTIGSTPVAAMAAGSHFPNYGEAPVVLIFNVSTQELIAQPTTVNYATEDGATFWASVSPTSDVAIEATEGGAMVYYINNNTNSIEGFFVAL